MPFVEANGERLYYERGGAGPTVLFLHVLGGNSYFWRGQVAALEDRYDCIAVDCRGHGASSYNGTFTVPDVAADLAAMLDTLEVASCHVVGLAMGGPIALGLNARGRGLVRSVTFLCSFVDKREGIEERYAETVETLDRISMRAFGRQYAEARLMPATPQAAYEELTEAIAKVPPQAYLDTVRAVLMEDFTPLLAQVRAPSLVILGDRDEVTPLSHSRAIADGIPGARLEIVAEAGHLANIDRPDAVNALLAAFLDAQPR